MNHLITVVVPCFNEEDVIQTAHQRLVHMMTQNKYSQYEIIYVDDGSTDETVNKVQNIIASDDHAKLIKLSRNFGHQAAVSAGINHCTGDVCIIIDADLQDPPELIPEMIKIWKDNDCNVVYGVRSKRHGESFFKRKSAKLFYRLLNKLSDVQIPLDTGDFRLIDQHVIQAFNQLNEKNKYIRGLFSWVGFKQCPIFYERNPRFAGKTKYPIIKMMKFAIRGVLYFSKRPLDIAIAFGFLFLIIDVILLAYVIHSKINNMVIPGWTSNLIINICLSAINLICLGIIGKYVGIIFDEIKNRPEYIVEKKIKID